MDKPLAGHTFLVTRPQHQAASLCQCIEEQGGIALKFPTISIQPIRNQTELKNIAQHLADIDIAIFVSRNAVDAMTPWWPDKTPTSLTLLAIGTGTKIALEKKGIAVDMIPREYNSEGLLALPLLQDINQRSVVIFCGENPRPLLSEQLSLRGANVKPIICYQRVRPTVSPETLQSLQSHSFDFIISTSQESLRNLAALFSAAPSDWLHKQPLLVISKPMAKLAHELGFTRDPLVANNATDQAIIDALTDYVTQR